MNVVKVWLGWGRCRRRRGYVVPPRHDPKFTSKNGSMVVDEGELRLVRRARRRAKSSHSPRMTDNGEL